MLVTACTRDLDKFGAKVLLRQMTATTSTSLSLSKKAIEELQTLLSTSSTDNRWRQAAEQKVMFSGSRRQIGKVSVIYGDMPVLIRTSNTPDGMQKAQGKTHKDSLLYIVDFENNAGCAVLADRRIKDKILAITESGSSNNMDSTMFPPTYKQGMYADRELMKGFSPIQRRCGRLLRSRENLLLCISVIIFAKYCWTQCDDPDPLPYL